MTEPEHSGKQRTRRIDAARHLLRPHYVRDIFTLGSQPSLRNSALAGLQAAITVAIALPLIHISPWAHLIGFASLGALVALFGRFASAQSRKRIVFFCGLCQTLAVLIMSSAVWAGVPMAILLVMLALSCGIFFFITVSGGFGAPGALIFVFAVGASMGDVTSLEAVLERTAATAIVAALAWVVCAATDGFRQYATPEGPFPAEPVRPLDQRLIAVLRITVGAAVAVFSSYALGANHPAWAAMGALAVMQGAHLHINMNRALQRMAGTVIGALMAWVILNQDPSVWTIIVILIIFQFATELIIGMSYSLGQVLVTPMALMMTHLGAPDAMGSQLALERVFDTLLGASIGIAISVLLSSIEDRRNLLHPPGRG